jgi:hypothetical protein
VAERRCTIRNSGLGYGARIQIALKMEWSVSLNFVGFGLVWNVITSRMEDFADKDVQSLLEDVNRS